MEEGNKNCMINTIKQILLKHHKLSLVFAYFYTHLFGLNRMKGKNRNQIHLKNCFMKNSQIKIKGRNNKIFADNQCVLSRCKINITGDNNKIFIGSRVSAVDCEIHIEDNNNLVWIGMGTHISGRTHLACMEGSKITIGERCLFSSDIVFRTGDSHSILDLQGKRINQSKDIRIEDHVWIGNKTIVTKGAKIAQDSIAATGAIVTEKFDEPNVILGGIPAKVIKRGINWDERRI